MILYGHVNGFNISPKIKIQLISSDNKEHEYEAIIDTGFNGDLIAPLEVIEQLGLEYVATINAELANGEKETIELYSGHIKWFDNILKIAIGATRSQDILLGTHLLTGFELMVNFKPGWVKIETA